MMTPQDLHVNIIDPSGLEFSSFSAASSLGGIFGTSGIVNTGGAVASSSAVNPPSFSSWAQSQPLLGGSLAMPRIDPAAAAIASRPGVARIPGYEFTGGWDVARAFFGEESAPITLDPAIQQISVRRGGVAQAAFSLAGAHYQAGIRFGHGAKYTLVSGNTLRKEFPAVNDTGWKSALRLENSGFDWAEQNNLRAASESIGPLGGSRWAPSTSAPGNGNSTDTTEYVVYDSNILETAPEYGFQNNRLTLNPGLHHAVIRNNIFQGSATIHVQGENFRKKSNILDDVWVVNNTRVNADKDNLDAGSAHWLHYQPSGDAEIKYDPFIRLKNFHFANNLSAVTSNSFGRDGQPVHDGVWLPIIPDRYPTNVSTYPSNILGDHPRTSTRLAWREELKGNLPTLDEPSQKSRWWVANNAWSAGANAGALPTFLVDDRQPDGSVTPLSLSWRAWNSLNPGTLDDKVFGAVSVASNYAPARGLGLNFCSSLIYGVTNKLVAAWDYKGLHYRPISGVTAGAVQVLP